MAKRVYTVLIVAKGRKAPRGIQISLRAVCTFMLLVMVFCSGVFVLYQSHGKLLLETARLSGVDKENAVYRADLERLDGELRVLLVQVAELDTLSQVVREIVSGENGEEPPRIALQSRSTGRAVNSLEETLEYLLKIVPQKTEEMALLLSDAEEYRIKLAHTPDFWPTTGRITSPFGWRRAPFSLRREFHKGIDIGAPSGTPVVAAADGVVKEARFRSGWGNLIIIDHGIYVTYYAHLRRISVKVGENVVKGQLIGSVGSTGLSTGPHLHFEIHENGLHIDPLQLLKQEAPKDGI
ncbi:MAG: M23 family metallopeptidase [Dethiobacter sp.]|jgi:murein DD-endopeptidase MepM/ murein hydrolase activator NlpD|nr:M23 family metallopeptidase [Dethiobacter sp.]